MTEAEIRDSVLRVLGRIAPEADLGAVDPRESLRHQLDIDSMDFLNFLIGVHEALGVEIPEKDYPRLTSLEAIYAYLAARSPRNAPTAGPGNAPAGKPPQT